MRTGAFASMLGNSDRRRGTQNERMVKKTIRKRGKEKIKNGRRK